MKKIILFFLSGLLLISLSAFLVLKDTTGIANYAGSPGEANCSSCHGGGSSATKGVTISATPSFSNGDYYPDSVYSVSVTIGAVGFSHFGFGCEVLTLTNVNSGTLQTPGAGAKVIATIRKNVTHNTPKAGTNQATFTFGWKAPSAGTGTTKFYVCGNAVNFNGNTSGDLPIPSSITLTEAVVQPTVDTTDYTGVKENAISALSQLFVYPQPTKGLSNVSYSLKDNSKVKITLCDISGREVKTLLEEIQSAGTHAHILDLTSIPAGVYFLKVFSGNNLSGQKLMIVN